MSGRSGMKPTAIDLFSGAGGLSEGLRRAGFRVLAAVEKDALASATYRANHKGVRLWERDIRRVSGSELMRATRIKQGELDLLAACPPCQGFSAIRTKNRSRRISDPRNALISEVLRLVRSIRPRSIMMENVPHLAMDRRFGRFCRALNGLGYHFEWDVLNAADYGVPQRRKRLVLLASKARIPRFPSPSRVARTVRQGIGALPRPGRGNDELHDYDVVRSAEVERRIQNVPHDGGSRRALGVRNQLQCHQALRGFHDVYGRMSWDKPAPTITGGCINPSKGRFLHPRQNRAITLREAALLQSFPRRYKFSMDRGRYAAAEMIGNALPPEFIRRIGMAIKKELLG